MAGAPRGVVAQRANRRWKPDRGGESRHAREQRDRWRAPRDPTRILRERARKRTERQGEGALGRRKASWSFESVVFDETMKEEDLGGPERRGSSSDAGSAEGRDRGRQRRYRTLGWRRRASTPGGRGQRGPSIVTSPGLLAAAHGTPQAERPVAVPNARCDDRRSWRFAVKRSSTRCAPSASGTAGPNLPPRGFGPGGASTRATSVERRAVRACSQESDNPMVLGK